MSMPCSSRSVAAVWRASCTCAARTPASSRRSCQSAQSSLESIGAPAGVVNTRSQSCQALPYGQAFGGLLAVVLAQLSYQWAGQGEDELGLALAGLDALATGEVPAATLALGAFRA